MIRLTEHQLDKKKEWVLNYLDHARNPADSSNLDANANVEAKNVATMYAEFNKDINIQFHRKVIYDELVTLFDEETAKEYIRQLEDHEIYCHDETQPFFPYCVAIDSTPFLYNGLTMFGNGSKAPQHLKSYCGSYLNLLFIIGSQFSGAIADVSFLKDFHYFCKKDFGEDYLNTHSQEVSEAFEQIVYTINTPAASRGFQSIFYNTSVFDEFYFRGLYQNSFYPNGDRVIDEWPGLNKLQKFFLTWFNKEREKSLLTFPVITCALKLTEEGELESPEWRTEVAKQFSEGNSFFIYMDKDVSTISSCCRLSNNIADQLKKEFHVSLGFGGVSTGSKRVVTLNLNRLVQDKHRNLEDETKKIHKYLLGHESWLRKIQEKGQLPVYDAGFIAMEKQYLTVGLSGVVEAAESLGIKPDYNSEYVEFLKNTLSTISDLNKQSAKEFSTRLNKKIMINSEFVPGENLGHKFYEWDKKAGYKVPIQRNLYNSYFYPVEEDLDITDKILLHGKETLQYLDGGSALHLNLEEHLPQEGFELLLDHTAKLGTTYWTYNVLSTLCNDCGHIDKKTLESCPRCHSKKVEYATRVIGFLKKVSSFSKARRIEASRRVYHEAQSVGKVE